MGWIYYSQHPIVPGAGGPDDKANMGSWKREIAECVQSLCKINFDENRSSDDLAKYVFSYLMPVYFMFSSVILRETFLKPS